jgi:glycosyltransferase involved in cell wall biosynthesis
MSKIKIQGGLGNQMFQYAYGRYFSLERKESLFLDTSYYNKENSNRKFLLDQYNIEAKIDKDHISNERNISEGYWQSEKYFYQISDKIRRELSPKKTDWDKYPIYKDIKSSLSVSIHVRRTDYTTTKHKIIYDNLSPSYYIESINTIKINLENKQIKIFIFTDDINWVKENIQPHIHNDFEYVSGKGFSDTEEHYLMSQCKHNIIANSTYSWWAAWLNPNPNKIIISPMNWFVDGRDEKDLIPKSWKKIINDPKISVIMPVYKNGKYLKSAIDSILDQTFKNFEFIIIEDKSDSDECKNIINSYNDPRIKYILNETKKGIAESLNQGILLSRGDYIARMDSDDISLPKRFENQYEFMEKNKDVSISGTFYKTIGHGESYTSKLLSDSEDIKAQLLFNSGVAHPTVIMRKSFLIKNNLFYRNQYIEEDYDLWTRISETGKITNIKHVLLYYRLHESNLMIQNKANKKSTVNEIRKRQLEKLGLQPQESDMFVHNSIICPSEIAIEQFLLEHKNWLEIIMKKNDSCKIYSSKSLKKILYMRWYNICGLNANRIKISAQIFRKSKIFSEYSKKSYIDIAKIFIKSFLKI